MCSEVVFYLKSTIALAKSEILLWKLAIFVFFFSEHFKNFPTYILYTCHQYIHIKYYILFINFMAGITKDQNLHNFNRIHIPSKVTKILTSIMYNYFYKRLLKTQDGSMEGWKNGSMEEW